MKPKSGYLQRKNKIDKFQAELIKKTQRERQKLPSLLIPQTLK